MSYFDDASLVMIPSGYKASKVYSVKPTDGTGDLTFTRSNDTATRVGPDGLIEKVRTNLYTYSQSFADASWLTIDATKVSTSATDPNGGNTAANITWTAGSSRYFYKDIGDTNILTVSFWVKSNGGGNKFRFFGNGTGVFSSDLTATSTWTRYSFSFSGSGATAVGIAFASDSSAANLLIAFAQLETGDIATDYIATTTAAVSVGPVANVPRLDYLGSSCPRLLLEPQRTNLVLYSEQTDNAAWVKSNTTISANAITSPDGYTNADEVTISVSGGASLRQSIAVTSSTAYTFSFYVKRGTATNLKYNVRDFTNSVDITAIVDYTSQTSTTEWNRIVVSFTTPATCTSIGIYPHRDSASTGTFYLWGAMLEAGSYATSYIPTLGAAVTRGADVAEKTGISSLIGSATGTAFIDIQETNNIGGTTNADILLLSNNSNNALGTYVLFLHASTGNLRIYFLPENISVTVKGGDNRGQRLKIAFAYSSGDFVCYVNGAQVYSASRTLGTGLDRFALNPSPNSGLEPVNQCLLFPTRLSNSSLAELSSL